MKVDYWRFGSGFLEVSSEVSLEVMFWRCGGEFLEVWRWIFREVDFWRCGGEFSVTVDFLIVGGGFFGGGFLVLEGDVGGGF